MDKVRDHFENEAGEFDRVIVKLVPHYPEMIEALVTAIPFPPSTAIRAIDLGCGTGAVAELLLARFPKARIVCLDLAGNMVRMARAKLAGRAGVSYVHGDFDGIGSSETYDVVVSSLALHHLPTDDGKRRLYRKIFSCLRPQGAFYNADLVLGSSDFLHEKYMEQWRKFMSRTISEAEIDATWIPKHEAEDYPTKLMDQTAWLAEIGFTAVDVVWKYYNFAVYGGRKP